MAGRIVWNKWIPIGKYGKKVFKRMKYSRQTIERWHLKFVHNIVDECTEHCVRIAIILWTNVRNVVSGQTH